MDFWKGNGDHKDTITILQGIKNKLPNAKVDFAKGYEDGEKTNAALQGELTVKAKTADVIIATIGIPGKLAGEARTLADIAPSPAQLEMLKTLKATGKPLTIVVQTGRPMVLTEVDKNYPSILNAWIGGTEHGNAVADILFGDVNPSAKTTMTFPYAVGQIPVYYNQYNTGRPHIDGREGPDNFWVSRYRDIPNSPLYPFGYGLSYSKFEYGNPAIEKSEITINDNVNVSVTVKNTGKMAGQEVVQLYIRDPFASRVRPLKELKDFKKILFNAGESKTVKFSLPANKLGFYDEEGNWLLEAGEYHIFVGTNSRDVKEMKLMLK